MVVPSFTLYFDRREHIHSKHVREYIYVRITRAIHGRLPDTTPAFPAFIDGDGGL
jgi:hypothetical protein